MPSAGRLLDVALTGRAARLIVVDASAPSFEAEFRHLAGRIAAETLARAAAGSLLLGADLKGDERLALQIRADGPLKGLLTEVDAEQRFRGYTQVKVLPDADPTADDFSGGLGPRGRLQVIRSTGAKIAYQGVTALRLGDIASDIEGALEESTQLPSRVWLDHGYRLQLTHSVGVLLQALPGGGTGEFDDLAKAVAPRAEAARPFVGPLEDLLTRLLPSGIAARVIGERPVRFACRCSRERVITMLKSLGPPEGGVYPPESRATCAFCNDTFEVPSAELT